MSTVLDIITQGLRESNNIGVGQSPSPNETTEALARLQSIVLSALGNEVGYIMEDWNVTASDGVTRPSGVPMTAAAAAAWTVSPQARLICNLTAATTIKMDPLPQDGQRMAIVDAAGNFATYALTLDGNGRKVVGGATKVYNTNDSAQQLLYRSDTANWHTLAPLLTTDDMPFPEEFDDYFITMVAMRMNPRYGKELSESSVARLEQQRKQLSVRYNQTRLRERGPGADPTAAPGQ